MRKMRGVLGSVVVIVVASLLFLGQEAKPTKPAPVKKSTDAGAAAQPCASDTFAKNLLSQSREAAESGKCTGTWTCVETWTTIRQPRPGNVLSGCYRVSRRCGCDEQHLGHPVISQECFGVDAR